MWEVNFESWAQYFFMPLLKSCPKRDQNFPAFLLSQSNSVWY